MSLLLGSPTLRVLDNAEFCWSDAMGGTARSELHRRGSNGAPKGPRGCVPVRCVSVSTDSSTVSSTGRPLKEIPGSYGLPFFGAFKDKLDYYWFERLPAYYENRMKKYNSTVYRMNTVPGPPGFPDPRVIVLLDQVSYPTLFDVDKVEKRNVFTGTYMPSVDFTGGYRILAYLDPSEEKHTLLKTFFFEVLKSSGKRVFAEVHAGMADIRSAWEAALAKDGKVALTSDFMSLRIFRIIIKSFLNVDPSAQVEASLGSEGPKLIKAWIVGQLAPIAVLPSSTAINLLAPLLELVLHTFRLPFGLFKGGYDKVAAFFRAHSGFLLDKAEELGLSRDEALHNLIFTVCFNTYGALPDIAADVISRVGRTSAEFQRELHAELAKAVKENGGINPKALNAMPLLESAVYEALRINPPVKFQYARAKKDLVVESHEASFKVKKGEMLAGYMAIACQDPKVFDDPLTFNPKRFYGEGRELLKYVLWSNGPETERPTLANKQCAGKVFVVTILQLFVAEIWAEYEKVGVSDDLGSITGLARPSS